MTKYQFLLLLALLSSLTCLAQQLDYPTDAKLLLSPKGDLNWGEGVNSSGQQTSFIPLKFHTIVDDNSWYNDTTRVTTLLDVANEKFAASNVQFFKCGGVNRIEDPQFANGFDPATIMINLHEIHGVEDAINVYIPNTITQFNGYSYSAPNGSSDYAVQFNGLVINGTETLSNDPMLFCHELGHYFGLYHTQSTPASLELANGSNCNDAGDYCCDTPAEYQGMCCANLDDCEYVPLFGTVTDTNGDTLTADVKNIMSVMQFNTACRDHFTPDQVDRINFYHETYLSGLSCPGQIPSGVNEEEISLDLALFPNPAHRSVNVNWNAQLGEVEVLVYSSTGRLFLSQHSSNEGLKLDVFNWPNGVYSVVLTSARGVQHERLLVQK